jgi:hypothetical protein
MAKKILLGTKLDTFSSQSSDVPVARALQASVAVPVSALVSALVSGVRGGLSKGEGRPRSFLGHLASFTCLDNVC